jgi:hypothetical protein
MNFPVELGSVMQFARAVGDPNPIYFDQTYARASEVGHVIAPPTWVESSAHFDENYRLRPSIGEPWFGSGKSSSGNPDSSSVGTGLLGEQHYEYRRHVRLGEYLSMVQRAGRRWEREGRRGGVLQFTETISDYFDTSGELVIVARSIVVRTSRAIGGG